MQKMETTVHGTTIELCLRRCLVTSHLHTLYMNSICGRTWHCIGLSEGAEEHRDTFDQKTGSGGRGNTGSHG
jgi:hypothetical protein